jgi:putative membrane protein
LGGPRAAGQLRRPPLSEVGSEPDPRFSFANERTFLAWIRTALALIAAGVAVTQILPELDVPGGRRLLGLPLIALGAVIAFTSYGRWDASERALRERRPLAHTALIQVLAVGIGIVGVLAAVVAIVSEP